MDAMGNILLDEKNPRKTHKVWPKVTSLEVGFGELVS